MGRNHEYFANPKHVEAYVEMLEGYENHFMTDLLGSRLQPGSSVLELGMGPGKDLLRLQHDFRVTGSDYSPVFIELFRDKYPEADLLLLDAVTLNTEKRFDCIFSNKVLMHLETNEMIASFKRQKELLNKGGILIHSLWFGDSVEEFDGLYFQYYNEETLHGACLHAGLTVIEIGRYLEEEQDDSLYLVAG